jgi:hypothetical protein
MSRLSYLIGSAGLPPVWVSAAQSVCAASIPYTTVLHVTVLISGTRHPTSLHEQPVHMDVQQRQHEGLCEWLTFSRACVRPIR